MNQNIKKLTWVVILTFLIPPIIVSLIGSVALLSTSEYTEKLIRHWAFYAFTTPFMIITPLIIRSMVKQAIGKIARKEYAAAVSSYRSILITFAVIATLYSFMAIVINTIVGGTEEEIRLTFINAMFYTSVANTPFFLKVLEYLDEIYLSVPRTDRRLFKIKTKFRVTTMISSFSGIGLMANCAYGLAWRMTNFPEMGITPEVLAQRLMLIGCIIALLQIAPNFILGNIFTEYIGKLKSVMLSISQKDLTKNSAIPSRDEFGLMSDSMETLRTNLKSVVERIKESSSYIRHTGEDLANMSTELSSDSSEQAAGAEEIASNVEEMASNINLSADNSERSAKISLEAKEHMEEGKISVDQTLKDVLDITEKIKYIDEIANQTNLLAINAYVEAANAGEAGEGFGVIAREVRNLADRSRSAASEIMELSRQTLKNSKISQEKITEIAPQIENMSMYAAEIATSSAEQRSASDQINSAIQTFNESSQRMAASSEELSASSQELQDKSKELDDTVSEFVV